MPITVRASLLLLVIVAATSLAALGGCQTDSHSQGLLEEKRSGGVSDPYIVRDPAAQKRPQSAGPTTQPADQAPAQ